jgi:hydrogenase nickel incorporation protein HypA/HybF
MHELSIMESALSQACSRAKAAGASKICSISLRIGALSGVVSEALEFAFEALAPGTMAEGAEMKVEHVPARFRCGKCNQEFQAGELFSLCPDCQTPSTQLLAGREMELASLEIE